VDAAESAKERPEAKMQTPSEAWQEELAHENSVEWFTVYCWAVFLGNCSKEVSRKLL
jgi:hypothetical protein